MFILLMLGLFQYGALVVFYCLATDIGRLHENLTQEKVLCTVLGLFIGYGIVGQAFGFLFYSKTDPS
jgi:hypothetical protein